MDRSPPISFTTDECPLNLSLTRDVASQQDVDDFLAAWNRRAEGVAALQQADREEIHMCGQQSGVMYARLVVAEILGETDVNARIQAELSNRGDALENAREVLSSPILQQAGEVRKVACDHCQRMTVVPTAEPAISTDGPHNIGDHRRWLARQLLDSQLSDREALRIVAYSPALEGYLPQQTALVGDLTKNIAANTNNTKESS